MSEGRSAPSIQIKDSTMITPKQLPVLAISFVAVSLFLAQPARAFTAIVTAIGAFCLGLVVLTSLSMAAEQFQSMGAGTKSCAVFARTYKDKPKTADMIYFSWAQGYMSGVNLAAGINNKDYRPANLNAMTVAAQQRFIRDFCDRNPLKDFREAVDTLLGNIRSTKSGLVTP